ncbi:MAG: hypothetical protein N3A68_09480 [Bacteroidia bacterium]|nr:hypothetical protein [Bacteroidia bacterium]
MKRGWARPPAGRARPHSGGRRPKGAGRYPKRKLTMGNGITGVRRWVEGRRYERIEAKKVAVEEVPRRLEAEEKVSSLVGWRYIRQALSVLHS